MEKAVKDRLEKPSKMKMTVEQSDNGGFHVTHDPTDSLSFEKFPGATEHHSFGPKDGKHLLNHIKEHLGLGGGKGSSGPISGKSIADGKAEKEVRSKGEDKGITRGKGGY